MDWEKTLSALAAAGPQATGAAFIFAVLIYMRQQEKGVREELTQSLQRLQEDKKLLQAQVAALELALRVKEEEIDKIRAERRQAEDALDRERRLADRFREGLTQ